MDKDFFKSDNKLSMMRWIVPQVTRMSWVMIFAGVFNIIYTTIKLVPVDWLGILMLLGGLTTFIGAAITGKWLQKKEEIKETPQS